MPWKAPFRGRRLALQVRTTTSQRKGLRMKRLTACLAFLLMCCLPAAAAAAGVPGSSVGVELVSPPAPPAVVTNEFINSEAAVSGADSAEDCIQRHLAELQLPLPQ